MDSGSSLQLGGVAWGCGHSPQPPFFPNMSTKEGDELLKLEDNAGLEQMPLNYS